MPKIVLTTGTFDLLHPGHVALLGELKTRHAMRSATPFAGGISLAQKDSVEDDSDRVPPAFERDQFRIAGTDDSPEENLSE